ncbi:MAG: hypothetical protein KDC98_16505 [Planctomycetes bacterium]|nr:hypothetical protein [Planctomycetota bacterium]
MIAARVGDYRRNSETERRGAQLEVAKALARAEAERRARSRVLIGAGIVVALMVVVAVLWSDLRFSRQMRAEAQEDTRRRAQVGKEVLIATARRLQAMGHEDAALDLYEKIAGDGQGREVMYARADLLVQRGRLREALASLRYQFRSLRNDTQLKARIDGLDARIAAAEDGSQRPAAPAEDAAPALLRGEELELAGDLTGALAALTSGMRSTPDHFDLLWRQAEVLRRLGRFRESLMGYTAAMLQATESGFPYYLHEHRRLLAVLLGMPAQQLVDLEQLTVAVAGDPARAWMQLGRTELLRRGWTAAERACREGARLGPGRYELQRAHGDALELLGRYAEALAAYDRAREVKGVEPFVNNGAYYISVPHADCERLVGYALRFPGTPPRTEWAGLDANVLARLCYHRGDFGTAAELWVEHGRQGRRMQPKDRPAEAAVLAFGDDPIWRERARDWLDQLITREHERWLGAGPERPLCFDQLLVAALSPRLARIREPEHLARLPEPERAAWAALWDRLDRVLREMAMKT